MPSPEAANRFGGEDSYCNPDTDVVGEVQLGRCSDRAGTEEECKWSQAA